MDVLYEVDRETYIPTAFTRGPWDPDHQHAGPPAALLARAIEAGSTIKGGQTVRLAFDILRPVPVAPLRISGRTLRPGRNVEQLQAVLTADGVEVMVARAWRMRSAAVPLTDGLGDPEPPPAPPEDCVPGVRPSFWPDDTAYHDALEWRFLNGEFEVMGPSVCWTRMKVGLIPGEPITPLEHLLVMGDAASGVSSTLDWATWTFANVDFNVILERPPEGEWQAMDAVTRPGEAGAAVCSAAYSDARGRVGSSTQALLIAPRV